MEAIRVACGQFEAAPGDKQANVATMLELSREARGHDARIVLFPELSVTGYLPADQVPGVLEPLDGPFIAQLRDGAKQIGIAIAFGVAEQDGADGRNSLVVLGAEGSLAGVYRKVHLWATEQAWARPGSAVQTFTVAGIRSSGWICYDTRFPEVGRAAATAGAELCLVPTAWLGPTDEWELAVRSRALDNSLFVAGADAINNTPDLECRGLSLIVSPKGHVLARALPGDEGVIWADLDPEELRAQRSRVPLLADRRL